MGGDGKLYDFRLQFFILLDLCRASIKVSGTFNELELRQDFILKIILIYLLFLFIRMDEDLE